jgi:hypothetical protein
MACGAESCTGGNQARQQYSGHLVTRVAVKHKAYAYADRGRSLRSLFNERSGPPFRERYKLRAEGCLVQQVDESRSLASSLGEWRNRAR